MIGQLAVAKGGKLTELRHRTRLLANTGAA